MAATDDRTVNARVAEAAAEPQDASATSSTTRRFARSSCPRSSIASPSRSRSQRRTLARRRALAQGRDRDDCCRRASARWRELRGPVARARPRRRARRRPSGGASGTRRSTATVAEHCVAGRRDASRRGARARARAEWGTATTGPAGRGLSRRRRTGQRRPPDAARPAAAGPGRRRALRPAREPRDSRVRAPRCRADLRRQDTAPAVDHASGNSTACSSARASGKRVCRLKGGDPMVFGRAGEELEALTEAGLPFQIVPGVSAAEGCAAYAGIPLTLRGVAQAVLLTTGHTQRRCAAADLARLAPGRRSRSTWASHTSSRSRPRSSRTATRRTTPVAIIENGTTDRQRVIRTVLQDLVEACGRFDVRVAGAAARRRDDTAGRALRLVHPRRGKLEASRRRRADELATVRATQIHQQELEGDAMIYDSILDTIGNTPVVRLHRIAPKHVTMYVKVEAFNPLRLGQGPTRARDHQRCRETAARSSPAKPSSRRPRATPASRSRWSARPKAIRSSPRWPRRFSIERRKIMRALGAKVILTPAAGRGTGMVELAAGARREARLVSGAPVPESRKPRLPSPDDRARDPQGLRGAAARLLGHGLGHGRHADRRRRGHQGSRGRT